MAVVSVTRGYLDAILYEMANDARDDIEWNLEIVLQLGGSKDRVCGSRAPSKVRRRMCHTVAV